MGVWPCQRSPGEAASNVWPDQEGVVRLAEIHGQAGSSFEDLLFGRGEKTCSPFNDLRVRIEAAYSADPVSWLLGRGRHYVRPSQ